MKYFLSFAVILILVVCWLDEDYYSELSDKKTSEYLIKKGWLPSFFSEKKITKGFEVHNIDTNKSWGMVIFENEKNIIDRCVLYEKSFGYPIPPRKIKSVWLSKNIFLNSKKYICYQNEDYIFIPYMGALYFYSNNFWLH